MPHQCTNCGRTFDDGSKEMLSGCPDCGGNKFQFRPSSAGSTGNAGDAAAGSENAVDSRPAADDGPSSPSSSDSASATSPSESGSASRGVSGAAADAGSAVRDWVRGSSSTESAASSEPRAPSDPPSEGPSESTPGATSESAPGATSESAPGATSESASETPSESTPRAASEAEGTADDHEDAEDRAQASARSDVVSPEELSAAAQRPEESPEADDPVQPGLAELREELNDQFESIKIVNPGQYELNLMELYDRDEYIISLREDGRYVIEVPDRWHGDDEEAD
ncbi:Zn-ribbon containing protein [Halobium palmae]|uniref:Zn-ribbon containing protein n=1 Tax=Halobium palmae TaxID=1776492 RepID=A0ABD5RX66_9EURY